MNIFEVLGQEFNKPIHLIEKTVALIDEGNTIPFIARYRKEVTGAMEDTVLRELDERLSYLRNLEERKEEVKRLIEEQGKLTEQLAQDINAATVLQRVEDLYKPFKQKKMTRMGQAIEKGLEPLAVRLLLQQEKDDTPQTIAQNFLDEEKGVDSIEAALEGAMDIIAGQIAEDADLIEKLREKTFEQGVLQIEATDEEKDTVYRNYYGKEEKANKIPNHRILAMNRGEKEGALKVSLTLDEEKILAIILNKYLSKKASPHQEIIMNAAEDSYKRLIFPSLERELRGRLKERAEEEALKVFAKNTEKLLMTPPVRGKRVIALDPGYRTGCKVAALNENGKLLAHGTIYPTKPKEDIEGATRVINKLIDKFNISVIAIGNGTASRETEEVVAKILGERGDGKVSYTIVNEAGASVYSASKLASKEYPDLDVTTRGAMSLGRRLQDPLAELVKIDPKHIGVGQYQHDLNQSKLKESLTNVVEDCVNRVGVDLNTASPSLLSYISGISQAVATNIVARREEEGAFTNRKELLKVAKLGPKAFEQCAGFLRITEGQEPLDNTGIHPESYEATRMLLALLGIDMSLVSHRGLPTIDLSVDSYLKQNRMKKEDLAKTIGVGTMTLKDIVEELKKPGRDPREDAPEVVFRQDVRKLEDLKEGMVLSGTVRNVVDFGAFVDIGVKEDGLVHVSQLSNKFIRNPMEIVSIGDNVRVKIIEIDLERKKIGLSMKDI